MRIDLGLLQMELDGRPDGTRPLGSETYLDYLLERSVAVEEPFELSEEDCQEIDREFVQYYYRRICWLKLQEYDRAVKDADHTLALMDLCGRYPPDEQWMVSHEQYRQFVLFHRIQAAALSALDSSGAESAVQELNLGLERVRELFTQYEAEDQFDDDELVKRLIGLREMLRSEYDVGRTLSEQLEDAVAAEQYELAAQLRDELARRRFDD